MAARVRFPLVESLLKDWDPLNLDGHPSVIIVGKSGLNTGRDVRGMGFAGAGSLRGGGRNLRLHAVSYLGRGGRSRRTHGRMQAERIGDGRPRDRGALLEQRAGKTPNPVSVIS